jgi:stage II sporulation protein GA (sporulation sigma-E factor processing peptidase)
MDLKVMLLSAAGCYLLLTLAGRRMGRHTRGSGELISVRLELEGRRAELTALVDTGNTLTDPMGNRPVLVAEAEAVRPLFPPELTLTGEDLRQPAEGLERLSSQWEPGRFRLLPYRTVGGGSGLLLALRVDRAEVGGQRKEGLLVALSPGPVSDGGGFRGLIGNVW